MRREGRATAGIARVAALVVSLVLAFASFVGRAAEPAEGKIPQPADVSPGQKGTVTWTGPSGVGVPLESIGPADPGSLCLTVQIPQCDIFTLTFDAVPNFWTGPAKGLDGDITVSLDGFEGGTDIDLYIYDANGEKVDESTNSSGDSERASIPTPVPGQAYSIVAFYYLGVTAGYKGTATLTLRATSVAGDDQPVVAPTGPQLAWGVPTKVTPELAGGYEPSVLVDHFGNIFSTAHKENAELVLSPDTRSPTLTRSMSWDWVSSDGGKTFANMPGYPLGLEDKDFGDEGDLAVDDAGHLYMVDTKLAEDSITRWTVTGLGQYTMDLHSPVLPTLEDTKDRPWITAHGDGHAFFLNNEGTKGGYTLAKGEGSGFGPGRYIVHASYDGGASFDPYGYSLKDSGWCRPAADHAPGSKYVYAVCTNDGGSNHPNAKATDGTLWSFVSEDDGHTFSRYEIGIYTIQGDTDEGFESWPTVEVAPDGSIWALFVDQVKGHKQSLRLFHSTDHGRTWSGRNITPERGQYEYAWLSISHDGHMLGFGVYHRKSETDPWRVYASVWQPPEIRAKLARTAGVKLPVIGTTPRLTSLDETNPATPATYPEAPGDYMGSSFNPDGTLSVVWTRVVIEAPENPGVQSIFRDIYHARSAPIPLAAPEVLGKKTTKPKPAPHGAPLPGTGVPAAPVPIAAAMLVVATALWKRLRTS